MPSLILLHIIGGVCLLLFGLRLVRNGVTRAFGVELRKVVAAGTKNRVLALFSGIGVTALLQSSTATTMIVAGFAGQGIITVTAALAVILGADIGTTLVAQALTFNLSWISPVLIIVGYVFFSAKESAGTRRQMGRILLGLGLVMLALVLIKQTAAPLKESDVLPLILKPLDHDPVLSILVGALLTWLFHSSLAIVLLLTSMVHSDVVPLHLALVMVLGANVGNVIAPMLASLKDPPAATRIPAGNFFMRMIGVLIALALLSPFRQGVEMLSSDPARTVVNFHMMFNIGMAVLFLPFLGPLSALGVKLIPDKDDKDDPSRPKYIDPRVLDEPTVALTNASREVLRIADMTDQMLQTVWAVFQKNDPVLIEQIKTTDTVVDKLYKVLKAYLVQLSQESMKDTEAKRHFQTLTFATNLEHVGDIIDRNLISLAEKKIREKARFSVAGQEEIDNLFQLVLDSIRLAQTVFISGDARLARQLVEDKALIKKAETAASMNHMLRLQKGVPETLATSDLHMDVIRDLRRINSLMTSIAYPILDDAGELRRSLLKSADEKENGGE